MGQDSAGNKGAGFQWKPEKSGPLEGGPNGVKSSMLALYRALEVMDFCLLLFEHSNDRMNLGYGHSKPGKVFDGGKGALQELDSVQVFLGAKLHERYFVITGSHIDGLDYALVVV